MRLLISYLTGSKSGTTEVFQVDKYESILIGREQSATIRFDLHQDDVVSRNHAVIEWKENEPTKFTITDLLSSNGTYVNGLHIDQAHPLNINDTIRIGKKGPEFIFCYEDGADGEDQINTNEVLKTRKLPVTTNPGMKSSVPTRNMEHLKLKK